MHDHKSDGYLTEISLDLVCWSNKSGYLPTCDLLCSAHQRVSCVDADNTVLSFKFFTGVSPVPAPWTEFCL